MVTMTDEIVLAAIRIMPSGTISSQQLALGLEMDLPAVQHHVLDMRQRATLRIAEWGPSPGGRWVPYYGAQTDPPTPSAPVPPHRPMRSGPRPSLDVDTLDQFAKMLREQDDTGTSAGGHAVWTSGIDPAHVEMAKAQSRWPLCAD